MWTIQNAIDLYHIDKWGAGYFGVNERGHIVVCPTRNPDEQIDLKVLVDELQARGIDLPILVRFSDILQRRIDELHNSFDRAIREYDYRAEYRAVYPIKVNQQRHVVESILAAGQTRHLGLECGSKPELLIVLGLIRNLDSLIVCNGYKDEEYIELALNARKLGLQVILVVEKFNELPIILDLAETLQVEPIIGLRVRLSSRGAGRWEASAGDRAKFGLGPTEVLNAVRFLQERDALAYLRLLHYHLGSQICSVRTLRDALREAGRYYIELKKMGVPLEYLDVGGGLAVDYDGSQSDTANSANYNVQEYANTVVYELKTVCNEAGIEHPTIVSESGRALTAHHSVLVTNVLGAVQLPGNGIPDKDYAKAPVQVWELWDLYKIINETNFQEHFHDVQDAREQLLALFKLGYISLEWHATGEALFWAALRKIWQYARQSEFIPEELEGLHERLSDIYYCNLSVFQSLPDWWAIGHVFPIVPLQRLNERPDHRAILADITCDSDGKIDRFSDLARTRSTLPVHGLRDGERYLLGIFLVGAYQEILGDLHNLFGDNNAVHVSWDARAGTYRVDHVEDGDTVTEVLHYVQHNREELVRQFRQSVERAVREKRLSLEDSRRILQAYRQGFEGYTYIRR